MLESRPSKEQLSPLGDWLIVQVLEVPEVTEGGLLMALSNSGAESYGQVLKVGPGYYQNGIRIAPTVQEGQVVMFKKGRGVEMRFKSENVLFMTERDLFAIVE